MHHGSRSWIIILCWFQMAPYSSTLAWKIPWMKSLVGFSPWGREELDTTEWLHFHFHFSLSCIGEGNGNPLQCSCLENPRGGGAWWAAIYSVAQSRTRLKWLSSSSSWFQINSSLLEKYLTISDQQQNILIFLNSYYQTHHVELPTKILRHDKVVKDAVWRCKARNKISHKMLIFSKREFTITMVNMLKTNGRKYATYKDRWVT